MKCIYYLILLALISGMSSVRAQQRANPIIDVHMHAHAADRFGKAGIPNPITGQPSAALTEDAVLRATLREMERYNIVKAVAVSSMESAECWRKASPDRFIKAARQQQKSLLQRVREATDNHSSTNRIAVYFDPKYEKKALELRAMLEEAMAYFDRELKVRMDFTLAVLDESQWERVAATMLRRDVFGIEVDKPSGLEPYKQPYGIPMSSTPPYIIFLPATPNNIPTNNIINIKPNVPQSLIKEIEASGFTYEKAAQRMPELIGFHEIGHQYSDVYGIHATNQWLREFLASYFAFAFLSEKYPIRPAL